MVSARTDIPRLGNQLHAGEDRVLPAGVEKSTPFVEPIGFACQDSGKIEAEAINPHLRRPVSQ